MSQLQHTRELSRLWELRNMGKVTEAHEGFLTWGVAQGLTREMNPVQKLDRMVSRGIGFEDALSYCLLEVSLLRNQLKLTEARECCALLEGRVGAESFVACFQLKFQAGLNAFALEDYAAAFEALIEARALARDDIERALVYYSQCLVMEELGMPHGQILMEFETLLPTLSPEWRLFFEGKLSALRVRMAFIDGKLSGALVAAGEALDDYSRYFFAWCAEIPYLDLPSAGKIEEVLCDQYVRLGSHWLSSYRVRTLRGLLLEADLVDKLPLRDAIERFYLWTWRWLANPTASALARLLEFQKRIRVARNRVVSPEHHQMLENAIRWLGLFAYLPDLEVQRAIGAVHGAMGKGSLYLEYEKYVLDYGVSLRGGDQTIAADTLDFLRSSPGHRLGGFYLPFLVESLAEGGAAPAALGVLATSLRGLLPSRTRKLESGFMIHAHERKIRVIEKGRCVDESMHGPLVSLALLLQEKTGFTKAEVLRYCFGLSRYDAYLHDTKVANLLSQGNRLFRGAARFQVKGDRVVVTLNSNAEFRFEGASVHSRLLSAVTIEPSTLLGEAIASPSARDEGVGSLTKIPQQTWVSRAHIERCLKVSKATATRRLSGWLNENLIECRGRGRASRYRVAQKFVVEGGV